MRKMLIIHAMIIVVLVVLFAASCGKQTMQNQLETASEKEVPVESATSEPEPQQAKPQVVVETPDVTKIEFVAEAIYFEFDSSDLSINAPRILNDMADHMRLNPSLDLRIQGHCDERGTDAYNMELGKRRAESAKMFLVGLGISSDRLDSISYGESRPNSMEHNEAAWAKNRRVEFEMN